VCCGPCSSRWRIRPERLDAAYAAHRCPRIDARREGAADSSITTNTPRWATFKKIDTEYANAIKAAGGTVDWINLPEIGIKGNGHMMMQDQNNMQVADVIQKWLVGKGLAD
jgi:hypothetical protein